MGFFHFWDQRAFQKFLHFIEDISEFLNPDCSYTIESDHPKTIREKILLKVVLLSFQSSLLQYFILKVSIWKRILLNVIDPFRVNPCLPAEDESPSSGVGSRRVDFMKTGLLKFSDQRIEKNEDI